MTSSLLNVQLQQVSAHVALALDHAPAQEALEPRAGRRLAHALAQEAVQVGGAEARRGGGRRSEGI